MAAFIGAAGRSAAAPFGLGATGVAGAEVSAGALMSMTDLRKLLR